VVIVKEKKTGKRKKVKKSPVCPKKEVPPNPNNRRVNNKLFSSNKAQMGKTQLKRYVVPHPKKRNTGIKAPRSNNRKSRKAIKILGGRRKKGGGVPRIRKP